MALDQSDKQWDIKLSLALREYTSAHRETTAEALKAFEDFKATLSKLIAEKVYKAVAEEFAKLPMSAFSDESEWLEYRDNRLSSLRREKMSHKSDEEQEVENIFIALGKDVEFDPKGHYFIVKDPFKAYDALLKWRTESVLQAKIYELELFVETIKVAADSTKPSLILNKVIDLKWDRLEQLKALKDEITNSLKGK